MGKRGPKKLVLTRDEMVTYFWSFVDKSAGPNGCWLWKGGSFHNYGYGILHDFEQDRRTYSHRFSLELKLGRPILPRLFTIHSCDNPPCCNPAHLSEGTSKVNQDDANAKARRPLGEKDPRSKINNADVLRIRERRAVGELVRTIAADFPQVSPKYVYKIASGDKRKLTA